MTRRIKKPAVRPELRRQWLHRFEQDGESPPRIAKADHFDVRTVRKNIELSRQEREQREARSTVLREALHEHYLDLIAFAQKLDAQLAGEASIPASLRDERMWSALKEHLPRSPIWKALDRREHIHQQVERLEGDIKRRLEAAVEKRTLRGKLGKSPTVLPVPEIVAALVFDARATAQGESGLGDASAFKLFPADKDTTAVHYGPVFIGNVPRNQAEALRKLMVELKEEVTSWEEYDAVRRYLAELERLRRELRDELAVIILRRVIPGRCRYCPV